MKFFDKAFTKGLKKEKELLDKAKKDNQSFGEIYKYLINDVFRYSYSILNDKHDAEDVTSQTFVEFYKKINEFEWKNLSMKFWLFKTARNFCLTKFKRPTHEDIENYPITDELEISFVDKIMTKDLIKRVEKEIQTLAPIEQEIIALRIWEGISYSEIAEIQEVTENAAKKRFYRTIDKLRKKLEEKNIKSLTTLPLLFTATMLAGASKTYAAPASLSSVSGFSNLTIKKQGMKSINLKHITKFSAFAFGASAVVVGGYLYFNNTSIKEENKTNSASSQETQLVSEKITVETPAPSIIFDPKSGIQITLTPTQPPTPSPTVGELTPETSLIERPTTEIPESENKPSFIFPTAERYTITQYSSEYHKALDISPGGQISPKILAAESGIVEFSGFQDDGDGYVIIIRHENYTSSYSHLAENSLLVKVGDNVSKGQEIATMGQTGVTTGIVLHFEITKDGEKVDPYPYILNE